MNSRILSFLIMLNCDLVVTLLTKLFTYGKLAFNINQQKLIANTFLLYY